MTTPAAQPVKPPRPPSMSLISYDREGNIRAPKPNSFSKWKHPLNDVRIETVDQGRRITLTRVATLGVLSLGAAKKEISVVFVTGAGDTFIHKVKGRAAADTLAWAVAFNAWRDATG